MAAFLDALIQLVGYLFLFVSSLFWFSINGSSAGRSVWWQAVIVFVVFCINWGYYAVFEILWKGQTPGKRWAGIRVIKDTGRPINAFEAIVRNLIRVFDYFPGFYGVGVVTMLLNAKHRRLGDFVAGTLVVHESSDRESQMFFNYSSSPEFPLPQAAHMILQEAELIETFLARRLDLTPQVRIYNARQIAGLIAVRLGIPPESRRVQDDD